MIIRIAKIIKYLLQFIYYKNIRHSQAYNDVIYTAVKDLGGIYVKLLQFICLRADFFSDDQKIIFLGFYDEVPLEKIQINEILSRELGSEKLKNFISVEQVPFASGTFGQVYKARLSDKTDVVIKIKRKGLLLKLKADFFLLRIFIWIFNQFYYQRYIDINGLVKEFEANTYEELDYEKEAEHARYFYNIYVGHPYVFIPKTYTELTTQNILVQDYVGGITVTDLIRLKAEGKNQEYFTITQNDYHTDMLVVIRSIAYELGMQAFKHDIFYADPHPGNIKILPNNRYAFIDFGIVGISPKNRRNYYNIIKLMTDRAENFDMHGIGKEFLNWGALKFYKYIQLLDENFSIDDKKLTEVLLNKYVELLNTNKEKFREIELREKENFVQIYFDIIKTGQYLNVKIPEGMLASLKTVAIYKAWNNFLEPEYHHMRQTYQDIVQNLNECTLVNKDEIIEKNIELEDAIEAVLDWVGGVAESDVPFYNKLSSLLKNISYV